MFGRTRCKNWTPLATQQLRLRHLVRIIGYNVSLDPCIGKGLYYTLHLATMCAPFYTSEKIDKEHPKWKEVEFSDENGHNSGVVIRIWLENDTKSDTIITVWGVYFSGLIYLGNKIQDILPKYFEANTIIFEFIGGYFTSHKCLKKQPIDPANITGSSSTINSISSNSKLPFINNINLVTVSNESEPSVQDVDEKVYRNIDLVFVKHDVRQSYNIDKLQDVHSLQLSIRNTGTKNEVLRSVICKKCPMFDPNPSIESEEQQRPTPKQNQSILGLSSLNKILNEQTQPTRFEREQSWKLKKKIEVAKFNCKLLSLEKDRKTAYLRQLTHTYVKLTDENDYASSLLMDRYRQLSRDLEKMREWRKSWVDTRDTYLHSSVYLNLRRKQLMSELLDIYPIEKVGENAFTICGVYLPESESLADNDDAALSVALGYVTHAVQMCSIFLHIPLRYPVHHNGSRSKIYDYITDKIPDKDREFPLYSRGKDQRFFQYAVYLLNKNIAQLRWYCGLPTQDLRATLPNLVTLLQFRQEYTPKPENLTKKLEKLQIGDGANGHLSSQNKSSPKPKSCDNFISRNNSQLLLRSHCVDCNIEQGLDLLDPRASQLLCHTFNEHSSLKPSKRKVTRSMGDYEEESHRRFNNPSPSSEPLLKKQEPILPECLREEQRTEFLEDWLNSGPALVCSEEHLYPDEYLGATISRDFQSDEDLLSRDSSDLNQY